MTPERQLRARAQIRHAEVGEDKDDKGDGNEGLQKKYEKKHHKKTYTKQHRNKKKTTKRMMTRTMPRTTKPLKEAVQRMITENEF